MQNLTIWDLLLTPVYLLVLSAIAHRQRDKRYPAGHSLRPYFLPGLYLKFGGAIFIGLLYQFYYKGGDTYKFFHHTLVINSALSKDVGTWLKLITQQPVENNPELYKYVSQMFWYRDTASYMVASIGAVFGLLHGTSYLPIAVTFAYFSFTGTWALYRTFVSLYPALHKQMAVAFLFIPSTFVWGSGVFKDTVCMFGLGWMIYTVFRLFIFKDFSVKNTCLLALSFYLVALIKLYILMAFLPALVIWLMTTYSDKITYGRLKSVLKTSLIFLAAGTFYFLLQVFAAEMEQYSLDNLAQTAATTRNWIFYVSEQQDGSGYDLGEFSPTLTGMLKKFPQAVAVTLFRPFPWEAKKMIIMLNALEATAFTYFTFLAFRRRGIWPTFKLIGKDATLLFCLIFSLIFAFAVGITTYNFGTLSRYKIPCLPFYGAFLVILIYEGKNRTGLRTTQGFLKDQGVDSL
ncbi:hypothetical protein SAMN05444008_11163 [Cnuella takakiae]|uniref:Dolichyl-phosphate-mannose-protein mannosyltransferase n=1 Tax=Cnuella takakiae TaxID=1302690 RepID=A0A1M5DS23_9BACT|nr:hypothetical protein [Cnuella takakiae]OLY93887.1 hypothetical protein BUE76_19885 [Cnuella takakiae]SHF69797.1 hypothetical protein SAMN05444008_11163 [Cnuella takakiae]